MKATRNKMTVNGVDFLLLLDEPDDQQAYKDMLERAMAVYQGFDFGKKLEQVVVFRNRQDFTDFYASEYGFKDEYSEEGHAIHYPYGMKSISGELIRIHDSVALNEVDIYGSDVELSDFVSIEGKKEDRVYIGNGVHMQDLVRIKIGGKKKSIRITHQKLSGDLVLTGI